MNRRASGEVRSTRSNWDHLPARARRQAASCGSVLMVLHLHALHRWSRLLPPGFPRRSHGPWHRRLLRRTSPPTNAALRPWCKVLRATVIANRGQGFCECGWAEGTTALVPAFSCSTLPQQKPRSKNVVDQETKTASKSSLTLASGSCVAGRTFSSSKTAQTAGTTGVEAIKLCAIHGRPGVRARAAAPWARPGWWSAAGPRPRWRPRAPHGRQPPPRGPAARRSPASAGPRAR